jgi:DinB superfamily
MDNNIEVFLSDFRKTVESAAERMATISEEQSRIPQAEGKWSRKEIVGHLIDSAANNHARFVRAQFTSELKFPEYDGDQWVAAQRYNEEPWDRLVNLWKLYNLHMSHLIEAVPEATRQLPRTKHNLDQIAFQTVSTDQPVTLEYFMRDYVDHLRHHLKQIFGE